MKELTIKQESTALGNWAPAGFEEAIKFSQMIAKTEFAPKGYRGKPEDCLMAMMTGNEVGLGPMAALQNIAVINGHPSIWGDAALALVKASPDYEYLTEEFIEANHSAICKAKKRGEPETVREFTVDDAKRAGLWDKQGPWKTYPKRMLQLRARSWAIRDTWPHVLKGLSIKEEAQDIPMENVTPPESKVEAAPEKTRRDKVLEDLEKALDHAIESGLLTEEEKAGTMEKAGEKQTDVVLEKYVQKVIDRLSEVSNGAA